MGATLIQPFRVSEEGLRVVKLFCPERNGAREYRALLTVPEE
jgi:hypothetical protein